MVGSRLLVVLILLGALLAGCSQPFEQFSPEKPPFPARSFARDKPIFMLHGYDFAGDEAADPTAWLPMKAALQGAGWNTPLVAWGYYGCDVGFDAHANDHGQHAAHYGATAHFANACGPMSHTRNTPIEHLAYHWAWTVYDLHNKDGTCVDAVAHSMGGLIVRYALSRVAANDPEFPPKFCVEDVVTLGTPHAGSDLATLAELFGVYCPSVQCTELQPSSAFQASLAQSAQNPGAYGGTDWTLVGSEEDGVVTTSSAWAMSAAHRVLYFAVSGISHAFHPNYLDAFPATNAAVGYQDAGEQWLVNLAAPFPLGWVDQSLVYDETNWIQGYIPTPATASPIYPTTLNAGLAPGRTIHFQGACSDTGNLRGASWSNRAGSGDWVASETDMVQIHANPWTTSYDLRFPNPGTFGVRLQCITDLLAVSSLDWTIQVDASYNSVPAASRLNPPDATVQVVAGRSTMFQAGCANPEGDLNRAEWWSRGSGDWALTKTDTVQIQADPWTTSQTYTPSTVGTFQVEARCYDAAGATSTATWTLQVTQAPATPGAARVAPSSASGTVASGSTVYFEVACEDANNDLDRAEWWAKTPTKDWFLYDTDTVQFDADPWSSSINPTLSSKGSYTVRASCTKTSGATASVEWSINAT